MRNHVPQDFGRQLLLRLTRLGITFAALLVVDSILNGMWFDNLLAIVAAAVLLSLVNAYIRPLVLVLTLPLNIMSLGLFTLVINAGLLQLVNWMVPAFHLEGFATACLASLLISITSFFLNWFLQPNGVRVRVHRHP